MGAARESNDGSNHLSPCIAARSHSLNSSNRWPFSVGSAGGHALHGQPSIVYGLQLARIGYRRLCVAVDIIFKSQNASRAENLTPTLGTS